jgi:putative DNA primase/helicase
MTISRFSFLSIALDYQRARQPVIAVGEDKSPYRRGWNEYFTRPQTEDEVKEQFSNGVWGIAKVLYPACNYIHLDFDGEHSEEAWFKTGIVLPETARVETPSGGYHLIFKTSPFLRSATTLRRAVRIVEAGCGCKKGCGVDLLIRGYAIIPPSPGYHEDEDFPLEYATKIPDEVIGLALAKQRKSKSIIGDIPDGRRNVTLIKIAGTLRRQGMGYEEILERLLQQNKVKCKPPLEVEKVEKIAKSSMRWEPGNTPEEKKSEFHPMTAAELLNRRYRQFLMSWSNTFRKVP